MFWNNVYLVKIKKFKSFIQPHNHHHKISFNKYINNSFINTFFCRAVYNLYTFFRTITCIRTFECFWTNSQLTGYITITGTNIVWYMQDLHTSIMFLRPIHTHVFFKIFYRLTFEPNLTWFDDEAEDGPSHHTSRLH